MQQYEIHFKFGGIKVSKFITAKSLDDASDIALETPILTLMSSITFREVMESLSVILVEED